MKNIIAIHDENKRFPVNARELHEKLKVKSKFADWMNNRIRQYGFMQDFDYQTLSKILEKVSWRPSIEYMLTIDMAKELALVENNEMGKRIRRYFIEVERAYREGPFAGKEIARQRVNDKVFLSYNTVLQLLGRSQRSGSYSARRRKYPTEFVRINDEWFVSMDLALQIWKYAELQQSQKVLKERVVRVLESRKGVRQLRIVDW